MRHTRRVVSQLCNSSRRSAVPQATEHSSRSLTACDQAAGRLPTPISSPWSGASPLLSAGRSSPFCGFALQLPHLLEDETPEERVAFTAPYNGGQAFAIASPSRHDAAARLTVLASHPPPAVAAAAAAALRLQLIQEVPSFEALEAIIEEHALSLDPREVSAAIVRLIVLSGADGPEGGEPLDEQAADTLRLLRALLRAPMFPGAPPRLRQLGCPELAALLSALGNVRRDDKLRFELFRDLLHQLHSGVPPAAGVPLADTAVSEPPKASAPGWALLRYASPSELSSMAQAVSWVEELEESAVDGSDQAPARCTLDVRAAFAAIAGAALRQLTPCVASPATCPWDVTSLARFVSALARLDYYDREVMEAVEAAARAPGRMAAATPEAAALLLSGFARLRHDAPALFRHTAPFLRVHMHELRMKDLAVAISAFESRHIDGTRWRNEDAEDDDDDGCTLGRACAAAGAPLCGAPLLSLSPYGAHLDGVVDNGSFIRRADKLFRAAMVGSSSCASVDLAGGASSPRRTFHVAAACRGGAPTRPLLRLDSRIEPWDHKAGGARRTYFEHLLAFSEATSG